MLPWEDHEKSQTATCPVQKQGPASGCPELVKHAVLAEVDMYLLLHTGPSWLQAEESCISEPVFKFCGSIFVKYNLIYFLQVFQSPDLFPPASYLFVHIKR
jgi:hypothetical protein